MPKTSSLRQWLHVMKAMRRIQEGPWRIRETGGRESHDGGDSTT